MIALALLLTATPTHPRVAEVFEAIDAATDDDELRDELRRICWRESRCNRARVVGSHGDGVELGRSRWRRAVKLGLLRPNECPAHELGDDPDLWGTVGAFGTVAAFVVRHVGCRGPRALFDPDVAAKATVGHMRVLCRRHGACSCPERAAWWAGPGRFEMRSPPHQLHAVTRQCGPQPMLDWALAYLQLPLWHVERILEDLGELGEAIDAHLPDLEEETIAS